MTIQVADQDRALTFCTEVLGCELSSDVEVSPEVLRMEGVPLTFFFSDLQAAHRCSSATSYRQD